LSSWCLVSFDKRWKMAYFKTKNFKCYERVDECQLFSYGSMKCHHTDRPMKYSVKEPDTILSMNTFSFDPVANVIHDCEITVSFKLKTKLNLQNSSTAVT